MIISVDGVDTSTITMEEVLNKLRGPVDEDVDLVIRRGKNMEFPVTLTRAFIEVPTVKHGMINSIGYIRIIEFTPLTAEKVQAALDEFVSKKATSLIIDLRNNPGGLISQTNLLITARLLRQKVEMRRIIQVLLLLPKRQRLQAACQLSFF